MTRTRDHSACAAWLVLVVSAASAQTNTGPDPLQGVGDVSGLSFQQECNAELRPGSEATFEAELARAEKALAAGDADTARKAMNTALLAVYRSGADNTDVSVKCLGEPVARRWFADKLALQRLSPKPELYVTAADRGRDGLVEVISKQPAARFAYSLNELKDIAGRIDAERRYGAFMLPEEETIAAACREALPPLVQLARQRHQAKLAEEARTFEQAPTEQEQAMASSVTNAQEFASAMAGVEVDMGTDPDSLLMQQRVRESMQLLKEARTWNPDDYDDIQARPTSIRARERGDALLAKADDQALDLAARDRYYQAAIGYYTWGGWKAQAASATSARDGIQDSLNAQQQRQDAELEQALAKKREEMQQARDKMMKTEAEKKKFRDEADALEEELDL